jgi:hypothetical protein
MKRINSLCTICIHNINNKLCELENDFYNVISFSYMDECEDFVLEENDENSEETIDKK